MEATKIKMNIDGTFRAKVLQYKSDGNTLTEKWETLAKFAEGIYYTTDDDGYGNTIHGIVFEANGVYWWSRQALRPDELNADNIFYQKVIEKRRNFERDVLAQAEAGQYANNLQIEIMRRLGYEVADLQAAHDEYIRQREERDRLQAEEAERRERERVEVEERRKAEVLADGKEKLLKHEPITVEQIELIAEAVGYKIHIRTIGFIREKVTGAVIKENGTVTVSGYKLTGRNIDGTANVMCELYNRLKEQAKEEAKQTAQATESPQISTETAETANVSAEGENAAETKEMPQIFNCEWQTVEHFKAIPNIAKLAKAGIIINGVGWHTEYLDQAHNVLARVDNLGWDMEMHAFPYQGSGVFGKTKLFENWEDAVIATIDALTDHLKAQLQTEPREAKYRVSRLSGYKIIVGDREQSKVIAVLMSVDGHNTIEINDESANIATMGEKPLQIDKPIMQLSDAEVLELIYKPTQAADVVQMVKTELSKNKAMHTAWHLEFPDGTECDVSHKCTVAGCDFYEYTEARNGEEVFKDYKATERDITLYICQRLGLDVTQPPQSPETPQTVECTTDTPKPREMTRKRLNRAIGGTQHHQHSALGANGYVMLNDASATMAAMNARRDTLRNTLRPVTYIPRECSTVDTSYW